MTEIIQNFEDFVLKSMNLSISKLEKDAESDEKIKFPDKNKFFFIIG